MEDQLQKAETFLKSLPDLSQKICRLWPPGVVSVSAELDKHLNELDDGTNLFLVLPCSVKQEYMRKAGEVVVNSGLIALLCEKATPWLGDKQGDDVTNVIWALGVCTVGTRISLNKDGDLHRLLALLVNLLKESFLDHMAGTLQQGGDALGHSLGVLWGLARVEENQQHIHLLNILSVLKAYSTSKKKWISSMARLETKRRADIPSPNHDMVQFRLGQLKALEREGFNPNDRKLSGVFRAVKILTLNPGNRELVVQEGVLPYLEKGLVKCVSMNRCKERTTCSSIVITLQNLACAERNEAEIMKHKQLLDSLVSISIDQSHSHRPACIEGAKDALSNLGMNSQDMQNDGTRRTGILDMSSETEDSGRQIPMCAPQRMDSTNNGLTSSLPNGSPNLSIGVELEHMPHSGSTCSIQPGNMTGDLTPRSMLQLMSPDFMPHGAMSNSSQTNHAPPLVSPFHRPPFRMRYSVLSSGPMNSLNGMYYGSLSNNVQLSNVPPFTTPGHLPPPRMPFNVLPDGGMNGIPYGSMANTARPPAGAHGNLPPAMMNRTVPHSGLTNSVPPRGIQTNIQPGYVPHLPPSGMPSDCPARNTTDNPPAGRMSIDLQTASFSNSMNGILDMQNYIQPGNVHSGNTPSSGTHCIMYNKHGGLPYFGMTGGAPVLGMMGHEPNTTMLPDPRNAPKSISGNIRPEEETLNVGSSHVGSCTQIDPNSTSTVPMDSNMDNEQLSTIDSSSIRPTPSLPVVSRTESLSRSSVINTAPFSGNTAVSTSRSATAKSSSTETVQQGSLSPGPSSTAGNSSSHAPPAISISTTGGGLPSSSTFAKASSPIVPSSGLDFSVLSPCETLNSYSPQLPLYHESNLHTPRPLSVSSESASTPRSPDQQHITSPESRGSFSPSQPSPGQLDGVTTSEHAQEGFSAPTSPPHPGLPPADMNQEGASLYRPGEQNNNCMKTHAGEAQTCRIVFKAHRKPAALPSNPESESSSKAKNRAQRTVSSSKSSNKRAKLLPKLETVSYYYYYNTRIDRDMETEALETTSVTSLSTTILKAEGKRPRHYRNPKGGVSSQSKVSPSHAGGMLNQFQKSVQNCQPPFKCKECEKRFPLKKTFVRHVKEKHDPESSCNCIVCNKEFSCERFMKEHLKSHEENAHERYKCRKCEKGFPYRSTLDKHIKLCR